ncbi:MAG: PAS domain S-box protein [Mesorhizobium sp.]|uniref:sensor histidine kinase n=1 Tax=Mesorhizobium sp. TaxID=1871066 RepID=UPI000FEA200B|nr:HWE histidine kinase domain-containing protein [Mesorhizobium sp.]RWB89778.1 MAG: PAS domain S-box protein [Mesorhizobium sp.]
MSKTPADEHRERDLTEIRAALHERAGAKVRLRQSEENLRQFGEAASDVLWIRNAETLQWEYLTPAFDAIYGLPREKALAGDNFARWIDLVVLQDRDHVLAHIRRVRDGERVVFEYRICRPSDNEVRWLRDTDFPIRDETGKVAHIGGIGQDITRFRQAGEQQQARFAELQHHVRNTLAVIRSIVRRTMEQSESLDEATAHLDGRINAFARVQAAVTRNRSSEVELAPIIAEELRAAGAKEGENLTINGPALALAAKAAETIGLAVHELATNAVKYGALSNRAGRIVIEWNVNDDDMLRLTWTENGLQDLKPASRQGFGWEVLHRTLPYELEASVDLRIEPTGLSFDAQIPLRAIRTRA